MENNYFKCDGCGGYHPESEMEVVVLKLRKGQNCALAALGSQSNTLTPLAPITPLKLTPTPFNTSSSAPTMNGKVMDVNLNMIEALESTKL